MTYLNLDGILGPIDAGVKSLKGLLYWICMGDEPRDIAQNATVH